MKTKIKIEKLKQRKQENKKPKEVKIQKNQKPKNIKTE